MLDEVDSTMAEARRHVGHGDAPAWILARRQTAAHGRRGRAWIGAEGNFAATLVLRPACAPDQAALRSFTAAVAVAEALERVLSADRLTLKWPNDVLLDGAKVAGILLESGGQGGCVDWLAIGIGINLVHAPGAADIEPGAVAATSVAAAGGSGIAPEVLLTLVASTFAEQEQRFLTQGFDPIRRAWLARAARLGQRITARTMRDTWVGRFADVDATGCLVLDTAGGPQRIAAADVYF